MAIRIYALAKELNIENKALVDICTKAGVTGKGSALASLDDDEVAKVKAFVAGGDAPPKPKAKSEAPAEPAPTALTRDDYMPARSTGKIKVLGTKSKKAGDKPKDAGDAPKSPSQRKKPSRS